MEEKKNLSKQNPRRAKSNSDSDLDSENESFAVVAIHKAKLRELLDLVKEAREELRGESSS